MDGIRVQGGIYGDFHLLAIAGDVNFGLLAGGEEIGGINEILDRVDFGIIDPEKDVAFLQTEFRSRRVGFHIHNPCDGALHRIGSVLDLDAHPAWPQLAETGHVAAHLLSSADGKDMAGATFVDAGGDDSDDLALKIQHRRTAVARLHGHIHPKMRGGKLFAVPVKIPPGHESDRGAGVLLAGKSDRHNGRGNIHCVGVSKWNERAEAVGFEQSDSGARVAGEDFCGHRAALEIHHHIVGFQDHAGVSVNGASRINKKSASEPDAERITGPHANHRLAVLIEKAFDFLLDAVAEGFIRRTAGRGKREAHSQSGKKACENFRNSGAMHS